MASRSDKNAAPPGARNDGKSSPDSPPQSSQSSGDASERSALIRKTPFVAYTAAAIFTIYILAQPDSLGDLLVPTVVAGLVLAIGYMTWSELRG